jgi:hypothetical protein
MVGYHTGIDRLPVRREFVLMIMSETCQPWHLHAGSFVGFLRQAFAQAPVPMCGADVSGGDHSPAT